MPILRHKTPCNQCPLRKASAKGWLGDYNPKEFVMAILGEFHMPCHCEIDYDVEWRESQYPNASLCAGALIFMKNSAKLPRDATLAHAVNSVEGSSLVFQHAGEFLNHHEREIA